MEDPADTDRGAVLSDAKAVVLQRLRSGAYPRPLLDALAEPIDRSGAASSPEALAHVPSARPIVATGPLAPLSIAAKRALRRLIAWYIHPITADQSRYNEAAAGSLRRLERRVARLEVPWSAVEALPPAPDGGLGAARTALIRDLLAPGPGGRVLVLIGAGTAPSLDGLREIRLRRGDPLAALSELEAGSLAGVHLAGILPALAAAELIEAVALAATALSPGGWLAADAPDPTHPRAPRDPGAVDLRLRRWLLPGTVELLLEAAGLEAVGTRDLHAGAGRRTWYAAVGRRAGT